VSLKEKFYRDKLAKKREKGFRGYPLVTVAFYGPDASRASKVVAAVVDVESAEPAALERWFSDTTDVRQDALITKELVRLVETRGVKSVVMTNRIIGCPHQEGIDYPDGKQCPQCPYWASHDRWSGEAMH
jgi:hypothetical protein